MEGIRIAHLSDIHYNPKEDSSVSRMLAERKIFAEEYLEICLKELKTCSPDIILITGDISHEGDASAYEYLKDRLDAGLAGVPVLCAMGNHDCRPAFRSGFLRQEANDGPYEASVSIKGYRFLSMDSAWEKGLEGVLTEEMLDRLERWLENDKETRNILIMHHPVLADAGPMSFVMTDRMEKILRSGKLAAMFNGHVHGSYTGSVFGVPQFTGESLKTGCNLRENRLFFNDRAGYEVVSFDEKGDWLVNRYVLHPETETFFSKENRRER